jgi:hypothetical protein
MPRRGKSPKYPGLNIPSTVGDAELRFFLQALKERVEMLTGDRGDPEDRVPTIAELVDAGLIKSYVKARRAEIRALETGGTTNVTNVTQTIDYDGAPPPVEPASGVQTINGESPDAFGELILSLGDLSDVTLTAPAQNDVIRLGATDWNNVPQTEIVDGGNF